MKSIIASLSSSLLLCVLIIGNHEQTMMVNAFMAHNNPNQNSRSLSGAAAASPLSAAPKGFGAAPKNKKPKKPNKQQILKKLKKTYGGTTPQEIAKGTQERMDKMLQTQPSQVQLALQLYQQLQQWNYRLQNMSVLQQAKLPPQDMEGANRGQQELEKILKELDLKEIDMHNLLQQATWDASADAKAARSITGNMPKDIQARVDKGCAIVAETIGSSGKVLDVGCGFGVLVPYLEQAGVNDDQIYGVDLSSEMIRNAETFYPGSTFEAADFFQYSPPTKDGLFDAVLFCSAIHDFPGPMAALQKAQDLLRPGGKVVLLHAQGAAHVLNQVRTNPVLVQRGLPMTKELQDIPGWKLVQEPAAAKSEEESRDGYLAVLEKL